MTDLFEKSIQILELPKVLERLAGQAVTQEGKERCLALRPMTDPDDVQRALDETSAAVDMSALRGCPSFSGVKPVARPSSGPTWGARSTPGSCWTSRRCCGRPAPPGSTVRGTSGRRPASTTCFASLTANRFLEDKITGSIVGEDEIADAASPELASIRRHIRATASKVRDILQQAHLLNQAKISPGRAIITAAQRPLRGARQVGAQERRARPGARRVLLRGPPSSSSPWGW
ncbi:MAG: hypothetical protein ACLRWQ_21615 [Flavonifractor plautii]